MGNLVVPPMNPEPHSIAQGSDSFPEDLTEPFFRAVKQYRMIEEHDDVLLAISGGKDSFAMMDLFGRYRESHFPSVRFHATMILTDITCSGSVSPGELAHHAQRLGFEFSTIFYPLSKESDQRLNCFYCSMRRRTALIKMAFQQGFRCIALGHHLDDIVETQVMNMFHHGNLSTMPPRVDLFQGRMRMVRPLCFVRESQTRAYANRITRIPAHAPCPGLKGSNRKDTKHFLAALELLEPRAKENLFGTMLDLAESQQKVAGRFGPPC